MLRRDAVSLVLTKIKTWNFQVSVTFNNGKLIVELFVYFARSDFRLQVYVAEMIRTLQTCDCVRNQNAHLNQKYSLKPYGTSIKKCQGLSTYPSSTVSTFDEHLMLLGMDLTFTTTFKEKRMTALQFLQTAKEKTMPTCL